MCRSPASLSSLSLPSAIGNAAGWKTGARTAGLLGEATGDLVTVRAAAVAAAPLALGEAGGDMARGGIPVAVVDAAVAVAVVDELVPEGEGVRVSTTDWARAIVRRRSGAGAATSGGGTTDVGVV